MHDLRAIIVDDSRAMRAKLRKLLGESGIEVVSEASNGREALEKLEAVGPLELALIDWNMPEMNGYELLCSLRADARFGGMRVLMVTTETESSQVLRALDAGADEYLFKPFEKSALHGKLHLMGLVE